MAPVTTLSPAPSASPFFSETPPGPERDEEAITTQVSNVVTTETPKDRTETVGTSPPVAVDVEAKPSPHIADEPSTTSTETEASSSETPSESAESSTTSLTTPADAGATCPPCQRGAAGGAGAEDATVASPAAGVPGAQVGNGTYKRSVPEPEYWIVTVLKFAPEHVDETFVRDVEARLSKAFNDAYEEHRKRKRGRREAPNWGREKRLELQQKTQTGSETVQQANPTTFTELRKWPQMRPGMELSSPFPTNPYLDTREIPSHASRRIIPYDVTTATPAVTQPELHTPPAVPARPRSRWPAAGPRSPLRRRAHRARRAQESASPVQVYVHNVNVENNRTRLLYTAWQDGEPIRAVNAVAVVSDAIDDREMSVRMGHVVEVTKGEDDTRRRIVHLDEMLQWVVVNVNVFPLL